MTATWKGVCADQVPGSPGQREIDLELQSDLGSSNERRSRDY